MDGGGYASGGVTSRRLPLFPPPCCCFWEGGGRWLPAGVRCCVAGVCLLTRRVRLLFLLLSVLVLLLLLLLAFVACPASPAALAGPLVRLPVRPPPAVSPPRLGVATLPAAALSPSILTSPSCHPRFPPYACVQVVCLVTFFAAEAPRRAVARATRRPFPPPHFTCRAWGLRACACGHHFYDLARGQGGGRPRCRRTAAGSRWTEEIGRAHV